MEDTSPGPLELEMLPAKHGDALLLTWGPLSDRRQLLIDGGPASAYPAISARVRQAVAGRRLELLVLTHIDADHIEGTLLLANDADLALGIKEFWFNGPAQVAPDLGAAQGEMLAALIGARGIPLNAAFAHAAVCAADAAPLAVRHLDGGLTLTVLGPDSAALAKLRQVWLSTAQDEGLVFRSEREALDALRARSTLNPAKTFLSGPPARPSVVDLAAVTGPLDTSPPNRSSIVLLAEYAGNAVLLSGDATPQALAIGVRRLLEERDQPALELTALKLPHHGSTRNITPELLGLLPAEHYLFSSDGGKFGHPDDAGVAKCLVHGKRGATLSFNYRNQRTLRWQDESVLGPRGNRALYPPAGDQGIALSLPPRDRP